MRYFVSVGEASGDMHGAPLIEALKRADSNAEFRFLGGDDMAAAAGCSPVIHYREMAYMGFSEVLRNLGKVLGNLKRAKEEIARWHPDAVVLIDYPSFNLKLAKYAHGLDIPVYYYISPKIWAWKEWRVKDIKRYCRKVLSILPFEVEFYGKHGMDVEYVGNPSVEEVDARAGALPAKEDFIAAWGLDPSRPLLALVPGSRMGEIRNNLPVMDDVARRFPAFQPVIAGAPGIDKDIYGHYSAYPLITDATFELVRNSTCALVTSGTATLETALLGTPQVVCYRGSGSKVFYNMMKHVIKCPFVSLPNLIAGEEIVPELLMHLCNSERVATELSRIVPGTPGRYEMLRGYARMRGRLGESTAASKAAAAIVGELKHKFA